MTMKYWVLLGTEYQGYQGPGHGVSVPSEGIRGIRVQGMGCGGELT